MRKSPRLPPEQLAPYLLATADPPAPLAWGEVFANDNPVEVEVGFGKGLFLVNAGQTQPLVNFLGIEIVPKYVYLAATRLARRGLKNVKVARGDARALLRDVIPPASVQAVHVYFPDPWWKKRHHKRRVFTPEFAALCERDLIPGGKLHVVTDVADYFQIIQEAVASQTKLVQLPAPEVKDPEHDLDYLTNFERKYRLQGKPIYRVLYQKP